MPEQVKKNARAIGIDDGSFIPESKGSTLLVGVLLRADNRLEGVMSTSIKVDSLDSTEKVLKMLKKSRFTSQASFILLDGVNFAGFNFIDLQALHSELGIPVIAVLRGKPSLEKISLALQRFKDKKKRLALIESAGAIHRAEKIFFQCKGISPSKARSAISRFTLHSNLPEPVRLAHLIASGLTLGESTTP